MTNPASTDPSVHTPPNEAGRGRPGASGDTPSTGLAISPPDAPAFRSDPLTEALAGPAFEPTIHLAAPEKADWNAIDDVIETRVAQRAKGFTPAEDALGADGLLCKEAEKWLYRARLARQHPRDDEEKRLKSLRAARSSLVHAAATLIAEIERTDFILAQGESAD